MVRLSLVNLYLHGFAAPNIFEYDTLTSQDRWNEHADVILANPPFMSPKGGIKPHKRFSVQAKRSEVLFVDYMAEHLSPIGRAGIIVPEGIIFQSQSAHKNLRKMLMEDYLVAVVSLPTGVFNPYSGVKTSILILDKSLAKQVSTLGFFKVENDGFNLGAQRREIDKNDLPQVCEEITDYLDRLRAHKSLDGYQPTMGLVVPKEKITANGEYNLSVERYRENNLISSAFKLVPVKRFMKHVVKTLDPRNTPDEIFDLWSIPAHDAGKAETLRGKDIGSPKKVVEPGDVLLSRIIPHIRRSRVVNDTVDDRRLIASTEWIVFSSNQIHSEFLGRMVVSDLFHSSLMRTITGVGGSLSRANQSAVGEIRIPLPPIEIQKEIAAEIEGYQKVIDGARAVVENYQPRIPVKPEWPIEDLSEVAEIIMGQSPPGETYNKEGKGVPLINGPVEFGPEPFSKTIINQYTTAPTKMCQEGDLILCVRGSTTGRMNIAGYVGCLGRGVAAIRSKKSQPWINLIVNSLRDPIYKLGSGSTFPNINTKDLGSLKIPFPPLAIQQAIVSEIDAEQALVNANRELIDRFEKKIQETVNRVWGEE